ncbi:MAG TPA: hypothetical protein ENJ11_01150 [Gammaproteobacteria bacterium]|nr:hypothetical protein [Gammaproteobacteria bacterium]
MRYQHIFFCLYLFFPWQSVADDYYQPREYGSDSLYSPLGNFLSYSFDTLQLPDNFDITNFSEQAGQVFDHLTDPDQAIANEGGYRRFVNRQIAPVYPEYYNEAYAALPNYFLHLLGGGMVYRKDLEWFRQHDYRYPATSAVALAMTAELLQEILEKKTTTDDDEVADVYIFRPIGMLLFHNERFARAFMKHMDPAIWPSLQAIDITTGKLTNTGIHYIYRPPLTRFGRSRLFVYTGMNNMFGLSHALGSGNSLSWGIGKSVQRVDLSLKRLAILDTSFGLFYDRNKSLLASLVIHDTGGQRFRFNWYPQGSSLPGQLGYFLAQNEEREYSAGVIYRIQLGIGFSFH